MPFVPIAALSAGVPVLHTRLLKTWDEKQLTVAGLDDGLLSVFDGPRVLFSDGLRVKTYASARFISISPQASIIVSVCSPDLRRTRVY